ncbi:oligouridylate-binding protein 1-like isoform X2 [Magnolia sinica]|uniref:oligouridylate-binding protein 1-like isoform X2 n=1 Tax=Magnolia sinica TaxID=86752 RepID=UPI00265A3692|nr:oligouridylate-binding protein 1-like isoform X2 [Magnolia sinica]XP_058072734.1 oligouridylate-binding protein 1-like isoform X2 [Magnolia sinica]XP_058072735.1 oligouridylate-binding protein 1-like isoform X2 [Magnolia sinica]
MLLRSGNQGKLGICQWPEGGHFNIFVGNQSPEVTDGTLFACFSVYSSCLDARVMWDHKTGCSRGFGFVSFCKQQMEEVKRM